MIANVERIIESGRINRTNSKETIDISSLLCQICGSGLLLNRIGETKHMLTCSSPKCIFPFNCEDMKRYICQSNDLKDFIKSIFKIFSRPSTHEESHSDNNIDSQQEEQNKEEEEGEEEDKGVFQDEFYY